MRPPGLRPAVSSGGSEVDALQADVMRFVAIIGLSLAAIFSLLQEAEQTALQEEQGMAQAATIDQQAAEQTPAIEPVEKQAAQQTVLAELAQVPEEPLSRLAPPESLAAPSPRPQPAAKKPGQKPASAARPDPERPAPQPSAPAGFSLSFASEQALMELLLGQRAALYAISGDSFWVYDGTGKSFAAAQAPSSYHEMEAATVPPTLRNWMAAAGVEVERWGVVLPGATKQALDLHMSQQEGGELLIDSAGRVTWGARPSQQY